MQQGLQRKMRADAALINVVFTRAEVGWCIVAGLTLHTDLFHDLKLSTKETKPRNFSVEKNMKPSPFLAFFFFLIIYSSLFPVLFAAPRSKLNKEQTTKWESSLRNLVSSISNFKVTSEARALKDYSRCIFFLRWWNTNILRSFMVKLVFYLYYWN